MKNYINTTKNALKYFSSFLWIILVVFILCDFLISNYSPKDVFNNTGFTPLTDFDFVLSKEGFSKEGIVEDNLKFFPEINNTNLINKINYYGSFSLTPNSGGLISKSFTAPRYVSLPIAGYANDSKINISLREVSTNGSDLINIFELSKYKHFSYGKNNESYDYIWDLYTFRIPQNLEGKTIQIVVQDKSKKEIDQKLTDFPIEYYSTKYEPLIRKSPNAWVAIGTPLKPSVSKVILSDTIYLPKTNLPIKFLIFTYLLLFPFFYLKNKISRPSNLFLVFFVSWVLAFVINLIHIKLFYFPWGPGGDEWLAIVEKVLIPYNTGQFKLLISNIFTPHGDHTLLPTRLIALFIQIIFNEWGSVHQRIISVIFKSLTTATFIFWYFQLLKPYKVEKLSLTNLLSIFLIFISTTAFVLPINVIEGFNTPYHLLVFFSLATIYHSIRVQDLKTFLLFIPFFGFWAGMSLGSGALALLVCCLVFLIRYFNTPKFQRNNDLFYMIYVCLGLAFMLFLNSGLVRTSNFGSNDPRFAKNISDFLEITYVGMSLPGWPNSKILLTLVWIIPALIGVFLVIKNKKINNFQLSTLAIYIWALGQIIANSIARGSGWDFIHRTKYDLFMLTYPALAFFTAGIEYPIESIFEKRKKEIFGIVIFLLSLILILYTNEANIDATKFYGEQWSVGRTFHKSICIKEKYDNVKALNYLWMNDRRLGGAQNYYWGLLFQPGIFESIPNEMKNCENFEDPKELQLLKMYEEILSF